MNKRFPVGATYAPLAKATEVDISEWDSDISTLARLGLNTFRLFIAWDRIEKKHGIHDFSRVDRAFELAAKYGVHVIANAGGTFANLQAIYPPRWLLTECKCQPLVETPAAADAANTPRIKLCYDDPVYQREALAFITEAVTRYKNHPSLLAWSGWNEPRVPVCFCPHTLTLFRTWLTHKYGSLDALITAWSTEFPLHYDSWDEIHPQTKTGFEHGGYAAWLDWKHFCYQNRSDKFRIIAGAIKRADASHPLLSHLCGPHDADIFDCEDIGGTSIYTYFRRGGERTELTDTELSRTLNWDAALMTMGYRKNRMEPESFWVMETEAGPVSWVHNLMPRTYSGRKMNARDMIFVGHGARCLLRWLYRSRISDAQAGEFNLVGWDGSVTTRADEFGKLSQFLNANAELFLTNLPAKADVGILTPDDSVKMLFDAEEAGHKYSGLAESWYTALAHAGIPARTLNDRQVFEGALNGLKALIIPMRPYVGSELAKLLTDFVAAGGLLIAEAPFATKNMAAIHWEKTPGAGLTDVFGAQVYDLEKLLEDNCGDIPGFDFKAVMRTTGCSIDATYNDGAPAIISNKYGKGRAVMFNSIVSARYSWSSGAALRNRLTAFLAAADINPRYKLTCADSVKNEKTSVLYRSLPDGRTMLTVVNFSADKNDITLTMTPGKESTFTLLGTSDAAVSITVSGNTISFKAEPFAWAVFIGR